MSTPESSAGSVPPYGTFVRPSTMSVPPPVIGALPLMIRPPHLPRAPRVIEPPEAVSVSMVVALSSADSARMDVIVMGAVAVPSAMILPPCSITTDGASVESAAGGMA